MTQAVVQRLVPLLVLALGLLVGQAQVLAQVLAQAPTPQQLREAQARAANEREAAESAAMRARALALEERRLAERRVAIARRVQQAEARLADVDDQARTANLAALYARNQVNQRAVALAPLVPVMRRLSLWPAESLLAVPTSAEDAVRGLQLLQALSRRVAEDILALRLAEMDAERQGAAAAQQAQELAAAQGAAQRLALLLEDEMVEARQLQSGANAAEIEAGRRGQEAAARAGTLEAALAQLDRERVAAARRTQQEAMTRRLEAPTLPALPRGGKALPVAGQAVREFGAAGEGGPAKGTTFQAPAGARVVSPCGGRVSFAGAFRSYGNLLIVDCGDAYHFVLAGLERLDAAAGQRVLAGEPVGVLAAGSGRTRATLYLELRHHGQPVDPRTWFAARG